MFLGLVQQNSPEHVYAQKVLMICVLSIILTAPISAICMTLFGPKLLNKTTEPLSTEALRRSMRLSVRSLRNLTVDPVKELSGDEKENGFVKAELGRK